MTLSDFVDDPELLAQDPQASEVWIADLGTLVKTRPVVVMKAGEEEYVVVKVTTRPRELDAVEIPLQPSGLHHHSWAEVSDPLRVTRDAFLHQTGVVVGPTWATIQFRVIAAPRHPDTEHVGPQLAQSNYTQRVSMGKKTGPGPSAPSAQGPRSRSPLYCSTEAARHTSSPQPVTMAKTKPSKPQAHLDLRRLPTQTVKKTRENLQALASAGHWTQLPANITRRVPAGSDGLVAIEADYRHQILCRVEENIAPEYRPLVIGGLLPIEVVSFEDYTRLREGYERTAPRLAKGLDIDTAKTRMTTWLGLKAPKTPAKPETSEYDINQLMSSTAFADACGMTRFEVRALLEDGTITEGPRVERSLLGLPPGGSKVRTIVLDDKADLVFEQAARDAGALPAETPTETPAETPSLPNVSTPTTPVYSDDESPGVLFLAAAQLDIEEHAIARRRQQIRAELAAIVPDAKAVAKAQEAYDKLVSEEQTLQTKIATHEAAISRHKAAMETAKAALRTTHTQSLPAAKRALDASQATTGDVKALEDEEQTLTMLAHQKKKEAAALRIRARAAIDPS